MTQRGSSASFPALGSTALVAVSDGSQLAAARASVERTVADFDLACSRFRDDSELARVNAAAGSEVTVGPLLLEAVAQALRAAELTGGDVDPTVGRALIAQGYDRDFALLPESVGGEGGDGREGGDRREPGDGRAAAAPPRPPITIEAVPGWRTVRLDHERSTIRLARGVMLDLGATAKALAADHAAACAHEATGCGVLVSLGGDIAVAGEAPAGGWRVRVTDDHRAGAGAPGQWIAITTGGLATSSTTVRRWRNAAGEAHHVLDPASGRPVSAHWRTVSVAAGSCLDANIASTAAIVRGGPAVAWLAALGLPSRLVRIDGTVRHLAGWPTDSEDLPVESDETAAPAGAGGARRMVPA